MTTYEETIALRTSQTLPDPITWTPSISYRNASYRLLHHQQGIIGHVNIRLLEASNLSRPASNWSVLGLGPVKHLGLSKAHGAVSSYVTFWLKTHSAAESNSSSPSSSLHSQDDQKIAAASSLHLPPVSSDAVRSSVIPSNDNPQWNDKSESTFSIPLRKGLPDGVRVSMELRVDEERTAAEASLMGTGGRVCLGVGRKDITDLLLGMDGGQSVGDVWIDLERTGSDDGSCDDRAGDNGKVRVLLSYEPRGITPQRDDLVAMEAFARRNLNGSTIAPIIPNLQPLKVRATHNSFLLLEYQMPSPPDYDSSDTRPEMGTVRMHRNAVFVIERQTLKDAVFNAAMTPLDVISSTPLAQGVGRELGPFVEAAEDLVKPVVLSGKLFLAAAEMGGRAGLSGIRSAVGVVANTALSNVQKGPWRGQLHSGEHGNYDATGLF